MFHSIKARVSFTEKLSLPPGLHLTAISGISFSVSVRFFSSYFYTGVLLTSFKCPYREIHSHFTEITFSVLSLLGFFGIKTVTPASSLFSTIFFLKLCLTLTRVSNTGGVTGHACLTGQVQGGCHHWGCSKDELRWC